jgi:hypothetical protein
MRNESGNAQNLLASDIWLELVVVVVVLVVAEIGNSLCLLAIIVVAAEIVEYCAKYVADLGLQCIDVGPEIEAANTF